MFPRPAQKDTQLRQISFHSCLQSWHTFIDSFHHLAGMMMQRSLNSSPSVSTQSSQYYIQTWCCYLGHIWPKYVIFNLNNSTTVLWKAPEPQWLNLNYSLMIYFPLRWCLFLHGVEWNDAKNSLHQYDVAKVSWRYLLKGSLFHLCRIQYILGISDTTLFSTQAQTFN